MGVHAFGLMMGSPFPEEEEDEEEEESPWASEKSCECCGERLHFTEEIVHLGVSHAVHNGHGLIVMPFLCNEGQFEGDFYYDPLFFCLSCWEDLKEKVDQMVENAPPVKHDGELLECSFCACSVCEAEIFGNAYLGELHVSKKMPNGQVTSTFESIAKPWIVCIGCLVLINEHEVDLWYESIDQIGECQECTHIRCWRYAQGCSCPCHDERSEDEET